MNISVHQLHSAENGYANTGATLFYVTMSVAQRFLKQSLKALAEISAEFATKRGLLVRYGKNDVSIFVGKPRNEAFRHKRPNLFPRKVYYGNDLFTHQLFRCVMVGYLGTAFAFANLGSEVYP